MEIEQSHIIDAAPERLWEILLDPVAMAKCVPGMQSIEVVSDREYLARVKVKIAFISACFKVRTIVTEMTPPTYLRSESTGEDSSIGSSVKSVSEMFLTPVEDGHTELRVKVNATVLGKLGTLGLNPMRTKAERMWGEFCRNLETALTALASAEAAEGASLSGPEGNDSPAEALSSGKGKQYSVLRGFWQRLVGREVIRIEISRNDTVVVLHWPASHADQCLAWLERQLDEPANIKTSLPEQTQIIGMGKYHYKL